MSNFARTTVAVVVVCLAAGAAVTTAWASGVEIQEQGKGLGNAFAGAQAVGEDPSTAWHNPAGMSRLERSSIAAAGYAILINGDFLDGGSFRAPGLPFTGESGTTDEPVAVPAIYGVWKLNPRLRLGLAVNAPFGLVTEWGKSWVGRYYATRSELVTFNINPSISYRINKCWSIGVGVSAMYAEAELGNAIDFGSLLASPQAVDGHATVKGDSWGIGYNVGVLWEPSCRARVGLHYRSRVKQEIEGTGDFDVPPPAQPIVDATGRFRDTNARADMTMPDQLALGAAYDIDRRWTLQGSVVWTHWSLFEDLTVRFANPAEPDSSTDLSWDDAWRVALGVTFRPNRCWTFRLGTQWDQSPIPDDTRTPRIPLNDRWWASAGVGYRLGRHLTIDLSYAHIFVKEGPIDLASAEAGVLMGKVDGSVDIVGLQLTWDF